MIAEPIAIPANAGSGRRGAARIAELVRPFSAVGLAVEIRRIDRGHRLHAEARRLREAGFGTVIAAGRDGTVTAVTQALAGTGTALGVLPPGTFNFFARSIGLPPDPDAAAAALIGGRARAMDLAEVNGQVFLNNTSLGLYPAMLADREQACARWGRSRFVAYWPVLRSARPWQEFLLSPGRDSTIETRAPRRTVARDGERGRLSTPLHFRLRPGALTVILPAKGDPE